MSPDWRPNHLYSKTVMGEGFDSSPLCNMVNRDYAPLISPKSPTTTTRPYSYTYRSPKFTLLACDPQRT
ncbi:hypothetical protein ACHWQZ_G018147 [Mnemiopsis leidyi]